MPTGIHRYAYAQDRPSLPSVNPPLLAPGSTLAVYRTATGTLASLYTDSGLTTPLANPLTVGANAFYAYYADPSVGDLDEQFSGTGITTPYTLTAVLDLDHRITATSGDVGTLTAALAAEAATRAADDVTLQANITAEAATRAAADVVLQANIDAEASTRAAAVTAIHAAGIPFDLGGSLTDGQQSASQIPALNRRVIRLNGTTYAGYTLTVVATCYTQNAGTTVQPILRNLTTAANAGSGSAANQTTATVQTFTATIAAGTNDYELQMLNSNATYFTFASAYCILTK